MDMFHLRKHSVCVWRTSSLMLVPILYHRYHHGNPYLIHHWLDPLDWPSMELCWLLEGVTWVTVPSTFIIPVLRDGLRLVTRVYRQDDLNVSVLFFPIWGLVCDWWWCWDCCQSGHSITAMRFVQCTYLCSTCRHNDCVWYCMIAPASCMHNQNKCI